MSVRLSVVKASRIAIAATLLSAAGAASAFAQNPFAPTTPAPAPAAPATTPAPAAPAANPFAPAAPAATTLAPAATPAAPAPAAPALGALGVPQGPAPSGGYRVLARGVETTIHSPVTAADLSSRHNLVEILAVNPTYGERPAVPALKPAQNVHFKHDVWGLDFTFKPIRFMRVPAADGKERLIWYMVYHVKNGPVKRFVDDPNDLDPNVMIAEPVTEPFLFIPRFELESHDVKQTYQEKVLPEVVPLIQAREDKNRKLLNTAQITGNIEPSTPEADRSVWGVVTWEGVDPRTDRFTIYVHGLTNAYRWDDPAGAYQKGDPPGKGRTYHYQVLKINFWRPSDARDEHEDEIRFGIPGEVDYEWFYK
jgi:hypothetical protein